MARERKISKIHYSKRFLKNLEGLPQRIIDLAQRKEEIFRKNPFDPRLGTHKLKGREKEVWAFWINYSYRIKFIFLNRERVLFLEIGTHEIYK